MRREGLSRLLGAPDDTVLTSPRPLYLGGFADVLTFRNFVQGVTYVTGGLTGVDGTRQRPNADGRNYELMICTRADERWASGLISRLAPYTMQTAINPGETMDCPAFPDSELTGLLFASPHLPAQFTFGGTQYDLLLCIGITAPELSRCRRDGSAPVLRTLEEQHVFPFTDLRRTSPVFPS